MSNELYFSLKTKKIDCLRPRCSIVSFFFAALHSPAFLPVILFSDCDLLSFGVVFLSGLFSMLNCRQPWLSVSNFPILDMFSVVDRLFNSAVFLRLLYLGKTNAATFHRCKCFAHFCSVDNNHSPLLGLEL